VKGILFLAHRLPFPPDRGDKIRSHHVLKALAKLAPVHVGCFADGAADLAAEHELAMLCASHFMILRDKHLVMAGCEAIVRGEPVSISAFRDAGLASWVDRLLRSGQVDTIYVFSGQMGQYVPASWEGRLVVDLVDVDSAKFEAYAGSGKLLMRWINAREGRLMRKEEARLAERADHTLLISKAEAALLQSRLPAGTRAKVSAMGNGIDTASFDPAKVAPEPALLQAPAVVFTGQLDYPPNVAAVQRVQRTILPLIRQRHPTATFEIVGRNPVPEVLALDGRDGCRVWADVPDVRPFVAAAAVVLAPLDVARGVQNKVLEAMAMARPTVVSPSAATGIDADDGMHFRIAESDPALAEAVSDLIGDPTAAQTMGSEARHFVVSQMGWPAMLSGLPAFVGRVGR
jgi:sugar transferase (PEP-CTERM/EpsH1 system associated)